jgi:hypothetical protein
MRKAISVVAVVGSMVAVWACSSSSGGSGNNPSGDDSGTGSSSSGSGSGSGSGGGDDASASCPQSSLVAMIKQYLPDASVGDGGVPSCIQDSCSDELNACDTEACSDCETPLVQCAAGACITIDASSIPMFDGGTLDSSTCDAPGPECAALATCCTTLATFAAFVPTLASFSTTCTTNANSCNESLCMGTISAVDMINASICPAP